MAEDDNIDVPVPIPMMSVELNQVHDWTPRVIDRFEQAELEDQRDELQSIYDEHIDVAHESVEDEGYTGYISMQPDQWFTLVGSFRRLTDDEGVTRVWWLQRKLMNRLNDKLEELDDES